LFIPLPILRFVGTADCPPEVVRAKHVQRLIDNRAGVANLEDGDLIIGGNNSSDEEDLDGDGPDDESDDDGNFLIL